METMTRFQEEVLGFLDTMLSSSNEILVMLAACVLSVIGFIVLYKRGPRLGVPLSLSGILLILMAILVRLRNYLFLLL